MGKMRKMPMPRGGLGRGTTAPQLTVIEAIEEHFQSIASRQPEAMLGYGTGAGFRPERGLSPARRIGARTPRLILVTTGP
jgi:hypothetical protein